MLLNIGQVLHDRYQIESLIGQGGMSYVYRALDQKLNRTVAIKVLKGEFCEDEEFIRKFHNEAKAAARLNHPNVVSAFDVIDDEEEKLHYIVMELVEGITLRSYIRRKGRLEDQEVIDMGLQMARGMGQAHKLGIIHRDIKPQNIIVSKDGTVKIADFGIARAATQETVNATVMGSVYYISPEQARTGAADQKSDIYSFGCTLYEMVTGTVPYEGESPANIMFSHMESPVPRASDENEEVCRALDLIIFKCMQKKPERRYQTAAQLEADLERALADPDGKWFRRRKTKQGLLSRLAGTEEDDGIRRLFRLIAIFCILLATVLVFLLIARLAVLFRRPKIVESMDATELVSASETITITISELEGKLPDILGMTLDEAVKYLSGYDIRLRRESEEYSDVYPEGTILRYKEDDYETGDTVPVVLSLGPETLVFYENNDPAQPTALFLEPFSDIRKELEKRRIRYSFTQELSDSVETGHLISASKPDTSGTEPLSFVVSAGSSETETFVPYLVGMTEEEAENALAEAGLGIGNIIYSKSQEEAGIVLEQMTKENTVVKKGSAVSVTVSSGPEGENGVKPTETDGGTGSPNPTAPPSSPEKSQDHWYASLNKMYRLNTGGPGVSSSVIVMIRLRQEVNGEVRYTTLQSARTYSSGTELPIVFSRIEGARDVPSGTVEVVDAEKDSVLSSYEISFAP